MQLAFVDDEFNEYDQLPASVGPFVLRADRRYELQEPALPSALLHAARVMRRLPYYRGRLFDSLSDLGEMIATEAGFDFAEKAGAAFCDSGRRVVAIETLSRGEQGRVYVHNAEVVRRAMSHSARCVYLWHSHPTSAPESYAPSEADIESFEACSLYLRANYINLLDEIIIVAGETPISVRAVVEERAKKKAEWDRFIASQPQRPWRDTWFHVKKAAHSFRCGLSLAIAPSPAKPAPESLPHP